MADKVKVTLVKSPIGAIPKHRATVKALGLTKMHKTVELPNNDATMGTPWRRPSSRAIALWKPLSARDST